jgi:hypothetical protein
LAVLIGLGTGSVMAIAAGARRTDSAYTRFVSSSAPGDLLIGGGYIGLGHPLDLNAVARLPAVSTSALATYLPAIGQTSTGVRFLPAEGGPGAIADDRFGTTIDRWKLLSGRRPDPRRLDEAIASFEFARQFHVGVGDTVHLKFLPIATALRELPRFLAEMPERIAGRSRTNLDPVFDGPDVTVHVVGVESAPFEFPPLGSTLPTLGLTRAFYDRYAASLVRQNFLHVRLRPGASLATFADEVERINGSPSVPYLEARDTVTRNVQRPIHVEALVLWAMAGLVGVTVAVTLGHAIARQAFLDAEETPVLRAVGMTRPQLVGLGVWRGAIVGAAGSIIGLGTALAMSPIWPLGLARDAEPSPGLMADWVVLGLGAVVTVLFTCFVAGAATARSIPRRATTVARPSPSRFLDHRLPLSVEIGIRHLSQPARGGARARAPVWSAFVATALAVVTIAVAVAFATSTEHLLATRRLYGWSSDGQISSVSVPGGSIARAMADNPQFANVAAGTGATLRVDGVSVNGTALDDIRGHVPPDLVSGRAIRTNDEIVLGPSTLREIGAHLGDAVTVDIAEHHLRMRIVGTALFPQSGDSIGEIDRGAQITFATLRRDSPKAPVNLVRFQIGGRSNKAPERDRVREAVAPLEFLAAAPPTTITSFGRANDLPAIVAVIVGVLAVLALANAMATSVFRRRHDFAILETLGFVRRQRSATIVASATTFALLVCVVGIPVGLVAGHRAWAAVANALGVASDPTTNVVAIALIVPVVVLIANLVALAPMMLAGRTPPATPLRTG